MLTITPLPPEEALESESPQPAKVMLADGRWQSLEGMSVEELHKLQWEEEQQFAEAIVDSPKASEERSRVTGQAYDTICTILSAQQAGDGPLVMGMDARYVRLVLGLLGRQVSQGFGQPGFFEIGYGSGAMLKEVSDQGYPVGGLEVSATMREEAIGVLGGYNSKRAYADQLLLGDLRDVDKNSLPSRPSLVYWNDVFEHICPDEIEDYLAQIYKLLVPGGSLVTITPNWLMRPSDVTGDFCPPRTEARGLHLKEYRLAEVSRLLKKTGFRRVAAPLVVSKRRIFLLGSGGRWWKQQCEPLLDRLPWKTAELLCRGLGLSCTIAVK